MCMEKRRPIVVNIILTISTVVAALSYYEILLWGGRAAFLFVPSWIITLVGGLFAGAFYPKLGTKRLRTLNAGYHLLHVFYISCILMILFCLCGFFKLLPPVYVMDYQELPTQFTLRMWIILIAIIVVAEAIVFWCGMLRIFFTSEQLAIKWRAIAIICGFIPGVNLVVLAKMMSIVSKEVKFENERLSVNINRKDQRVCATKYPLLMVHGIFFRDFQYLNYWGRIPKALEENGAKIFYGKHLSAASVKKCGEELAERIENICIEGGFEKVNVIAHSKGGLDMRYAISKCGADKRVASLTTINTPHRGCEFADYLLEKIPEKQKNAIAKTYNETFAKLGDEEPDFIEGVSDLTHSFCEKFNEETPDKEGIYYQSVGSKQNHAVSGRFPLNMSYHLVKHFDGPNDGLVGEKSFRWGSDYTFLTTEGKRGISHGDMIDLNRENIPGFDVREFYIGLVSRLKEKGL